MGDVQRQAGHKADSAHGPQHDAEKEITGERAKVIVEIGRETVQPVFSQQAFEPADIFHALADPLVSSEVVVVAGNQPGEEKAHARDGRIEQRHAVEWRNRVQQVLGFFGIYKRFAGYPRDQEAQQHGSRQRNKHISQNRRDLATDDIGHDGCQFFQVFHAPANLADGTGNRRGSHRRLLGGEREVQYMHQHEQRRIIQAVGERIAQRRQRRTR